MKKRKFIARFSMTLTAAFITAIWPYASSDGQDIKGETPFVDIGDGILRPELAYPNDDQEAPEENIPPPQTESFDISFELIGTLDKAILFGPVVSYDTNHNGFVELIYGKDLTGVFPAVFYENRVGGFTIVHTLGVYGPVHDAGDFDGDGKADLLTQNVDRLRIYESSNATAYPTALVRSVPLSANIISPFKGGVDLDQDGKKEIIVGNNLMGNHTVRIYENQGDNLYALVYETPELANHLNEVVIGDFDNDGRFEFLAAHRRSDIIIYENDGDNSYYEIFRTAWDYWNGHACSGNDLDHDGVRELVITGNDPNSCYNVVAIFESDRDNHFIETYRIDLPYPYCAGGVKPAAGNVAEDSNSELVLTIDRGWRVYRPTGDNQYEEIYSYEEPNSVAGGLFLADTNRNGYQEIIIASPYIGSTKVYEYIRPPRGRLPLEEDPARYLQE